MKKLPVLLMIWIPVLCTAQSKSDYFHHDAAHTGVYSGSESSGLGSPAWIFHTGGKIYGSPALSGNRVLIGSGDGNLYALRIPDGKRIWAYRTGGAVYSTPAIQDHCVYFTSYDGYCYALDQLSGKLIWKFKTEGEQKAGAKGLWTMKPRDQFMQDPFDFFLSSPVLDEEGKWVYFGSGDGNVYALNAKEGTLAWKFRTGGIVHTSPALSGGILFIGSWDRYFYALDAKTGKEKWRFQTGRDTTIHLLEGIQSSATIADGKVFFGCRDGHFYALDEETGKQEWAFDAANSWVLTTGAYRDHTIYIGTSDTYQFIALDANTGREKYRVQANGYVYSSPALQGHLAYFGDFSGKFFAVNTADGKIAGTFQTEGRKKQGPDILKQDKIDFPFMTRGLDLALYSTTVVGMKKLYTLGPILSSPVIAGGRIYFGSADGNLYALRLGKN